jgi:hypothetical protein
MISADLHRWSQLGVLILSFATIIPESIAAADEPSVEANAGLQTEAAAASEPPTQSPGWQWWVAPPANFYPQYIADPRRAQSALLYIGAVDSEIPESSAARTGIRLGARFSLFRVHPRGNPDRGVQLDLDAGFFGHFDIKHSLDNIGWDGVYALTASWKPSELWEIRIGSQHDSAHVGDEFAERSGRQRIDYTRVEFIVGVSCRVSEHWRGYGEAGYGYELEDFQDPGRLQIGVEYVGPQLHWKNRLSLYAAVDLTTFEERDWKITPTIQVGVLVPTGRGTSRYRLALEYSDGRSQLGEFSFHDESYLAFGLFFDL